MSNVNWWLMALAFVLGLVLTFFLLIRRAKREVPVYASSGAAGAVGASTLAGGGAKAKDDADDAATIKARAVDADADTSVIKPGGAAAGAAVAGAAATGGEATEKFAATGDVEEEEPYGAGSIRVKGTAVAPAGGYTVKGNEDSMLYHTTESPSYEQTIAEIWFRDVESAEAAGFHRWDSGKSQRGKRKR